MNLTPKWPFGSTVDPSIYATRTDWPKISIVTPSFNQGQFIEETILSILNQNYPNLEYIIIDGGSTDNTVEVIKKYEDRITYWVSEPDRGQADAINKGLEKCTGEIFNWINSDDYLGRDALFTIGDKFNLSKFCLFAGSVANFSLNGKKEIIQNENLTLNNFLEPNPPKNFNWHQPGVWFSMAHFKNELDTNINLHYCFDFELMMFILDKCNTVYYINEILTNFRLHNASKTVAHIQKFQVEFRVARYNFLKTKNKNKLKAWLAYNELERFKWYSIVEDQRTNLSKTKFLSFLLKNMFKNPLIKLNRFTIARLLKDLTFIN